MTTMIPFQSTMDRTANSRRHVRNIFHTRFGLGELGWIENDTTSDPFSEPVVVNGQGNLFDRPMKAPSMNCPNRKSLVLVASLLVVLIFEFGSAQVLVGKIMGAKSGKVNLKRFHARGVEVLRH